jgi:hypothetical protein
LEDPPERLRLLELRLLLVAWLAFMASAMFWLPAYKGSVDLSVSELATATASFAFVAVLAGIGIRGRARSKRDALVSALPVLALLGAAAVTGYVQNRQAAEFRGEPIFLYFGVTLWGSWAALVVATALGWRTRWTSAAGIAAAAVVAALGLWGFSARID